MIPAFQACMQSALFRANIKPPVELVVANLDLHTLPKTLQNRQLSLLERRMPILLEITFNTRKFFEIIYKLFKTEDR